MISEKDTPREKRDDWQEVQNYIKALNVSIETMSELPLSTPLFKKAHKMLLHNSRGSKKSPGKYRRSRNGIGGAAIKDAIYIPPVHTLLNELMSDLENFIHNENINLPKIIRIAIAHYQFETIHPFLDGNGRIGRLMIILFLIEKNIFKRPLLYISKYFEKTRYLYYDKLMRMRTNNDMLNWVKYFLNGVIEISKDCIQTLKEISKLLEEVETNIKNWNRKSTNAQLISNYIFTKPIFKINDIVKECDISYSSVIFVINKLENVGLITEKTGYARNKIYYFEKNLSLFK